MALVVGTVDTGIAGTNYGSSVYGDDYTLDSDCTLLAVAVAHETATGNGALTATWNDVAMTRVVEQHDTGAGVAIFLLKNPDIGTYALKITGPGAAAASSPWIAVLNISGARSAVGGTLTGAAGAVDVQGTAGIIIDVAIGDTGATHGTPSGTGVGTKVNLWNNQVISAADRTGALYVTHAGSDITTAYTGDIIMYAAAEVVEGSDFTPQIVGII